MDNRELLKKYLEQYASAIKRKRTLSKRLVDINLEMQSPLASIRYSDMPKGGGESEGAATLAVKKVALEERIQKQTEEMADTLSDVMDVLECLPSTSVERTILEAKYIDRKSWVKICNDTGYSRSAVFKKFNAGLNNLLKVSQVVFVLKMFAEKIGQ